MSPNFKDISDAEWAIVARRTFYECLVSSSPSSSISSLASLSSTRSRVPVKTLVDHIRNNAWGNYRNESLVDELQKSVEEVSCDGWINYKLFKKASRRWISKIQRCRKQDGNNNAPKDNSRSDDDKQNSVDSSDNDRDFENHGEHLLQSKTSHRYVADFVDLLNVSSYSPSSDTTRGCAMSDTTPDDMDSCCGVAGGVCDVSHVDLRLRVRQFDEENALLREELVRAEEHAAGLQRQLDNLRRKFDHTKEKCRQLERENDQHQEILNEVERKERDTRMALQKAEKERGALIKKVEHVEMERQQVAVLKSKLECCKKEKYKAIKQATTCQWELEEKRKEFELLKEQLADMTETHTKIEESYEKTIERLRHEIKNIQRKKLLLHIPDSGGVQSDNIGSTSPIGCFHPHTQSTPYVNNANVPMHDSLYDELKASGFSSMNESRIRELEDDLCWYNDEIRHAVGKINDIIEQLCHKRTTFHVPDLHLDDSGDEKTSSISWLLHTISKLSNMMNEIISKPKVKDASSQLCVDLEFTNERLFGQYGILSFANRLNFVSEKSECKAARKEEANVGGERNVFVEAFSMNSRLLGEYVEEVEIAHEADGYPDTDAFTPSSTVSTSAPQEIQEHTIIDPIVEELDRIIQCTNNNKCEEETKLNSSPSKNPRYRCIYTCAELPDRRTIEVNDSVTDSNLNSLKRVQCNLAATYVVSSGGDGLPLGTFNYRISDVENTAERDSMLKTISLTDSNTFDGDSVRESMPESRCLETTKPFFNETIPEEFVDSELRESKSHLRNLDAHVPEARLEKEFAVPREINESSVIDKITLSNVTEHCATPKTSSRYFPKRKISVFHRSFDIDTTPGHGEGGGSDTYRLTERSMSLQSEEGENMDDVNPDCMKMSSNTRKGLLNYRTNKSDSESSDGLSPLRLLDINHDSPLIREGFNQSNKRPIILAPTKLKFPLPNVEPSYGVAEKNATDGTNDKANDEKFSNAKPNDANHETHPTINETRETDSRTNFESTDGISISLDSKPIVEMVKETDEIERGVTFRKTFIPQESNFSDCSLLSLMEDTSMENHQPMDNKLEGVSIIVNPSDGESTSCDSSPKREPAVVKATLKLPHSSTHQKPLNAGQPYVHRDHLKSRDSWHDRSTEAGCGYQTRNDSTNVGSCYGDGGSAGGGIRGQDEKANVVPAVALAMSSGEDSSDSECDPMAIRRETDDRRNNVVVNETRPIWPNFLPLTDIALLGTSTPASTATNNAKNLGEKNDSDGTKNSMAQKRDKRKRLHTIRRSLSESGCGRSKCRCHLNNGDSTQEELDREEMRPSAFPSLTDVRLQESGIAKLSNNDDIGRNLSEADLERKYIALSVGLGTDRITLPRRVALSIRQRDQSERNLTCEIRKMHQDIQDLAPLCIDRESVERVERVRHQLEMITQCTFRVSCTAETLGAVHQENRISRAILLADRYLLVLRYRCAKLANDLSETKRILAENNIVVEEHNGELGDDMPRIRYRGMPTNNRTMMARRRASIATIFRPLGNFQDVAKEGVRQRNSVSGRVTLRRPSLTAESQKWEAEKLDRTDSSSSIGELREIFEQAESRRTSREENNNNVLRLHSSNLILRDCENYEVDVSTNVREELVPELLVDSDRCHESRNGRRTPQTIWSTNSQVPWRTVIFCIIISFFFGFYVQYAVSSVNQCSGKYFKWWSIEEILGRYLSIKNDAPRPI